MKKTKKITGNALKAVERIVRYTVKKNASDSSPACAGIYHQPKRPKKTSGEVILKVFAACTMALLLSGFSSVNVHAETMNETEPNDTKETAELIKANNETPQGMLNGTYAGQYVIKGSASKTDMDWFKVYLKAGTQYLTCNDYDFDYVIEDEAGNAVTGGRYTNNGTLLGQTAYNFNAPADGNYYVKITGIVSSSKSYLFTVGGPTYDISKCKIPCEDGIINMTFDEKIKEAYFNGSLLTLPKDAIAYYVKISGIKNTAIASARLTNEKTGVNIPLTKYWWDKEELDSMNMPVKSMWIASLEYTKKISFTPTLEVYYVYPIYSAPVK